MSCRIEEIFFLNDLGFVQLAFIRQSNLYFLPYFDFNLYHTVRLLFVLCRSLISSCLSSYPNRIYLLWKEDWIYLLSYTLFQSPSDPLERFHVLLNRINDTSLRQKAEKSLYPLLEACGRFDLRVFVNEIAILRVISRFL